MLAGPSWAELALGRAHVAARKALQRLSHVTAKPTQSFVQNTSDIGQQGYDFQFIGLKTPPPVIESKHGCQRSPGQITVQMVSELQHGPT